MESPIIVLSVRTAGIAARVMGFALTLFYIFTTFLTPAEIMPVLLPYRIMLVLLILTLLLSTFTMIGSRFSFKSPQLWLMFLLVADGAASVLYADRWLGGALDAVMDMLFLAGVVLMVCWNVTSLNRLRIMTYLLTAVGAIIVLQGIIASSTGRRADDFVLIQNDVDAAGNPTHIERIRGLGVLNDPNDLAQFLLIDLALLGCCWKPKRAVFNIVTIILPSLLLFTGILMTRSRGAVLGFAVMLLLLLQKRLGKFGVVLAVIAGAVGILAMTALTGRDLSMNEGSAAGRLDAWYAGMQMLKGSPLLGVGYQRFLEHNPLTAHNSYVLCMAELGVPGFFLWLGMIVSSILQMRFILTHPDENAANEDLKRCARSVFAAMIMFCVTGWFLSRSYTTVLFVVIGAAIALQELAQHAGLTRVERPRLSWQLATAFSAAGFVVSLYILLRIRGFVA